MQNYTKHRHFSRKVITAFTQNHKHQYSDFAFCYFTTTFLPLMMTMPGSVSDLARIPHVETHSL